MRVRIVEDDDYTMGSNGYSILPCNAGTSTTDVMDWGETEDYNINIVATAPVSLIDFNATTKDNAIALSWQTAQEENNKGFEIEHSLNGRDFNKISFVKGFGNSNSIKSYNYYDFNAKDNTKNYYRLKQLDLDGNFTYSKIVLANKNDENTNIKIYPNPLSNQLTIISNQSIIRNISIYNIYGQVVKQYNNTTDKTFDISNLQNGTYVLMIDNVSKDKFVKQ